MSWQSAGANHWVNSLHTIMTWRNPAMSTTQRVPAPRLVTSFCLADAAIVSDICHIIMRHSKCATSWVRLGALEPANCNSLSLLQTLLVPAHLVTSSAYPTMRLQGRSMNQTCCNCYHMPSACARRAMCPGRMDTAIVSTHAARVRRTSFW